MSISGFLKDAAALKVPVGAGGLARVIEGAGAGDSQALQAALATGGAETLGAKLRRLARQARGNNPSELPPLKLPTAWTTGEAITSGMVRSSDGKWYVAMGNGTTGATAPTHITGQAVTDGSGGIPWAFIDYAQISADDANAPTASLAGSIPVYGVNQFTPGQQPDVFQLRGCDPAAYATNFWRPTVFNSDASTKDIGNGAAVAFCVEAKEFFLTHSTSIKPYAVVIDGRYYELGSVIDAASARYWSFSFPTKKLRTIELRASRTDFVIGNVGVGAVDDVFAPPAPEISAVFIADSMWDGSTYGPFLPGGSEPQIISDMLGWGEHRNMAKGGTGMINPGASLYTYGQRIPEALSHNPDIIVINASTNDNGYGSTATYAAAVTAAVTDIIDQVRAVTSAPLVFVGAQCLNDSASSAKIAVLESAVATAVDSADDPRTFFIPIRNHLPVPWITGSWNNSGKTASVNATDFISADAVHSAELGTRKRARRIAEEIRRQVLPLIP